MRTDLAGANRVIFWTFFIAMATAVSIGCFIVVQSAAFTVNWMAAFDGTIRFGQSCQGVKKEWGPTDTFDSVFRKPHTLASTPAPYHGQSYEPRGDHPNDYFFARCTANLSTLNQAGSSWLMMGTIFGSSALYIEDELRLLTDDNWSAEIPLLPKDRRQNVKITVISRAQAGASKIGLASLLPPVATDQRSVKDRINNINQWYLSTQHVLFISFLFACCLGIAAAWLSGIVYQDIYWIGMIFCELILLSFIQYRPFGTITVSTVQASAVLRACLAYTYGCLFYSQLQRGTEFTGRVLTLLALAVGYSLIAFNIPRQLLLDLNLTIIVPSIVISSICVVTAVFAFRRARLYPGQRRRRLNVIGCVTLLGSIGYGADAYLNSTFAINLGRTIDLCFAGLVCINLFSDLVTYYRNYLSEKSARIDVEHDLAVAQGVAAATQMLAHDVRRPLSMLKDGVKVLSAQTDQRKMIELVHSLKSDVDRAVRSVNGMIADLVGSGTEQRIDPTSFDLTAIVHEAVQEVCSINPNPGVELTVIQNAKQQVTGYPQRIHRAIVNLISNAVEAAQPLGEVRIELQSDKDHMIELEISNSGQPIGEEVLAQLTKGRVTTKPGGSGLGLLIVSQIARQHSGSFDVCVRGGRTIASLQFPKSESGSVLRFDFPSNFGSTLAVSKKPDQFTTSATKEHKVRVLHLDDNIYRRLAMQEVGWADVVSLGTLEELDESLQTSQINLHDFQIIITDYSFQQLGSSKTGVDVAAFARTQGFGGRVYLLSNAFSDYNPDPSLFTGVLQDIPSSPGELAGELGATS